MKLKINENKESGVLTVDTTGDKGTKDYYVSLSNIHQWYPFNISYKYNYSQSQRYIYLVEENSSTGETLYGADILRHTAPLERRHGTMLHRKVLTRNEFIIAKAKRAGIPYITGSYNLKDIQDGFHKIRTVIEYIKDTIIKRYERVTAVPLVEGAVTPEQWDIALYVVATNVERKRLIELGEMYTMLTLMRKMVKGG